MLKTPVVFIIFRRPETTRRVWERIREAKPEKLFLIADGPRNPEEAKECQETRDLVARVDWPCEVHRDFSEANLGCRQRVVSGLNWVFGQVEEAIILEDDCLPDPSFFNFCEELLGLYRDDSRVMHIGGNNYQGGHRRTGGTWYFSRYPHSWGWATWRRAWSHYSEEPNTWKDWEHSPDRTAWFPREYERRYWSDIYHRLLLGEWDSWDHWWMLTIWRGKKLCVVPEVNLVENIGFGPKATHTTSHVSLPPASHLNAFRPPAEIAPHEEADLFLYINHFHGWLPHTVPPLWRRIVSKLVRMARIQPWVQRVRSSEGWKKRRSSTYREVCREKERLSKLEPGSAGITTLTGFPLAFNCPLSLLAQYREIFELHWYDFPCDSSQPRILDCGANLGLAFIRWKERWPKARITAWEADPRIAELARENRRNAGITDVEIRQEAVWTSSGSSLLFDAKGAGAGRVVTTDQKISNSIQVPSIRLADWLCEPIDFLKLDIEGAELAVLQDCESRLHWVRHLFVEAHQDACGSPGLHQILDLLYRNGFRVHVVQPGADSDPFLRRHHWDGWDLTVQLFAYRW